jgi:hypothetical protein
MNSRSGEAFPPQVDVSEQPTRIIELTPVPADDGTIVYTDPADRAAATEIVVTPDQRIVQRAPQTVDETLSAISPDGFAVDLNQLREEHLKRQQNQPSQEIVVTPDYQIQLVNPGNRQAETLSQVTPEGFAVDWDVARVQQETRTARTKLPPGTRRVDSDGHRGWMYDLFTRDGLGRWYTVWTMYHPSGGQYFTYLVEPPVEAFIGRPDFSEHAFHLYSDGRLCLSMSSGSRSLDEAFGRALIWATGIDFVLAGQPFPFNLDQ